MKSNMYTSEGKFDVQRLFERLDISTGSNVIDFGCGTGYYSKYPCELTDPNYTCATEEYCVTNSMCTHAHAVCCEM